jgi:hypothetical protein
MTGTGVKGVTTFSQRAMRGGKLKRCQAVVSNIQEHVPMLKYE